MTEPSIEEQRTVILKRFMELPRPKGPVWEARYRESYESKSDEEIRAYYRWIITGKTTPATDPKNTEHTCQPICSHESPTIPMTVGILMEALSKLHIPDDSMIQSANGSEFKAISHLSFCLEKKELSLW
jgi:hypothetical protein